MKKPVSKLKKTRAGIDIPKFQRLVRRNYADAVDWAIKLADVMAELDEIEWKGKRGKRAN